MLVKGAWASASDAMTPVPALAGARNPEEGLVRFGMQIQIVLQRATVRAVRSSFSIRAQRCLSSRSDEAAPARRLASPDSWTAGRHLK
jgi:hypothetical protein